MDRSHTILRYRFEKLLLVLGVLLLSFYVVARTYGLISSRAELNRFWQAQPAQSNGGATHSLQHGTNPDFRLWSEKRIAAYKMSLESSAPQPLAVLRIESIRLEVPVLEGTDDFTLNRAVGHIDGTPLPGQDGNVGIAGHRDGFFRGLKDIQIGDSIDLVTHAGSARYVVDGTEIVSPRDVSVLRARSKLSLTLVTCYPFYFVGHAPQRFIVHASIVTSVGQPKENRGLSAAMKGGAQNNR